jgi:hypothetical protein
VAIPSTAPANRTGVSAALTRSVVQEKMGRCPVWTGTTTRPATPSPSRRHDPWEQDKSNERAHRYLDGPTAELS